MMVTLAMFRVSDTTENAVLEVKGARGFCTAGPAGFTGSPPRISSSNLPLQSGISYVALAISSENQFLCRGENQKQFWAFEASAVPSVTEFQKIVQLRSTCNIGDKRRSSVIFAERRNEVDNNTTCTEDKSATRKASDSSEVKAVEVRSQGPIRVYTLCVNDHKLIRGTSIVISNREAIHISRYSCENNHKLIRGTAVMSGGPEKAERCVVLCVNNHMLIGGTSIAFCSREATPTVTDTSENDHMLIGGTSICFSVSEKTLMFKALMRNDLKMVGRSQFVKSSLETISQLAAVIRLMAEDETSASTDAEAKKNNVSAEQKRTYASTDTVESTKDTRVLSHTFSSVTGVVRKQKLALIAMSVNGNDVKSSEPLTTSSKKKEEHPKFAKLELVNKQSQKTSKTSRSQHTTARSQVIKTNGKKTGKKFTGRPVTRQQQVNSAKCRAEPTYQKAVKDNDTEMRISTLRQLCATRRHSQVTPAFGFCTVGPAGFTGSPPQKNVSVVISNTLDKPAFFLTASATKLQKCPRILMISFASGPPLQSFAGKIDEDFNVFERTFRDRITLTTMKPEMHLTCLLNYLIEDARDKAEEVIKKNEDASFQDVIDALRHRFSSSHKVSAAKSQLRSTKRVAGEAVEVFYRRIVRLARLAYGDSNDEFAKHLIVETFTRGLSFDIKLQIMKEDLKEPEDILLRAMKIEADLNAESDVPVNITSQTNDSLPQVTAVHSKRVSERSLKNGRVKGTCHNCKSKGHYASDCWREVQVNRKQKSQSNHKTTPALTVPVSEVSNDNEMIEKLKQQIKLKEEQLQFKDAQISKLKKKQEGRTQKRVKFNDADHSVSIIHESGITGQNISEIGQAPSTSYMCPYIASVPIRANGYATTALIDTGAQITVSSKHMCKVLGITQLDQPLSTHAAGFGLNSVEISGTAMVTYTIGSYKIRHKTHFTVSRCTPDPFGGVEIIIGTDILSRMPPVQFDFRNARLQIGDDVILLGSKQPPQILFSIPCSPVSLTEAISSLQQFTDAVQKDRDNKSVQFKNRSKKQSRNRNSSPRSAGHQTQVPGTTESSSHVRFQEVSDESQSSRPNQ